MVIKYDEEYVLLCKDVNTEPYEIIDIMDLIELWQKHKAEQIKPQTEREGE